VDAAVALLCSHINTTLRPATHAARTATTNNTGTSSRQQATGSSRNSSNNSYV